MKIGFELKNCQNHGDAYYGQLVERLHGRYGADFDLVSCDSHEELLTFDRKVDLMILKFRPPAAHVTRHARRMRSFLIDHGPLHCNRTPAGCAHFEVFPSQTLMRYYAASGLAPEIKGYATGFFLTEDLPISPSPSGDCLVYMTHWRGERANSLDHVPFDVADSIAYLNALAGIFPVVHVAGHVDDLGENFALSHRDSLLPNVMPVENGPRFRSLIGNVRAVFFEYSSVFAVAVWNPRTLLFQRVPPRTSGAVLPHANLFHGLMDAVTYPVREIDPADILKSLAEDPLRQARERARNIIYAGDEGSVYDRVLAAVDDALGLL